MFEKKAFLVLMGLELYFLTKKTIFDALNSDFNDFENSII